MDASRNKSSHILQTYICCLQNCTTHLRTKQKAKHFTSNEIIITSLLSLHSIMESAWTWNPIYNHFQFSTFSHQTPTHPLKKLFARGKVQPCGNPDRNFFFHFDWTHIRLLFSIVSQKFCKPSWCLYKICQTVTWILL